MKPDGYLCGECEHWDDINGCWLNCRAYRGKGCVSLDYEEAWQDDDDSPEEESA